MLKKQLLEKIEKRFGSPIRYPEETVALSQAIFDATHEYLSPSTLKRMFGWLAGSTSHRKSTLDILANYLGYDDFSTMKDDLGEDAAFTYGDLPSALSISIGDIIRISSSTGWNLTLRYEGEDTFAVVAAAPGVAEAGNTFTICKVD